MAVGIPFEKHEGWLVFGGLTHFGTREAPFYPLQIWDHLMGRITTFFSGIVDGMLN